LVPSDTLNARLSVIFALVVGVLSTTIATGADASSYTLKTLYTYCVQNGCPDGYFPNTGVVIDSQGVISGTASAGGKFGGGIVFSLTPNGGSYDQKTLHSFCDQSCSDGTNPLDLIEDVDGNLYGTTEARGSNGGGTIFSLTTTRNGWKFKTVYTFCSQTSCTDGGEPLSGLSYKGQASGSPWDGKTPLFGSVAAGGAHGNGAIFELVLKNGHWHYKVIHNIQTGQAPGPVLVDKHGNLFIASQKGGANGGGNFYTLANGTWQEATIYNFCSLGMCLDGSEPSGRLALDSSGNVFGVTWLGGAGGTGVAFEHPASGGFAVIYNFCGDGSCGKIPNGLTFGSVSHDLIGTTQQGGANGSGLVYDLAFKNGTWGQKILHDFCVGGSCTSGAIPAASVLEDASGNLFSTTSGGGNVTCGGGDGCGTVFELKK
jgi:uncharacterized repeat protein (TIGR03803 family)